MTPRGRLQNFTGASLVLTANAGRQRFNQKKDGATMNANAYAAAAPRVRLQRAMWVGLMLLCVIAAGVAIRRMAALASPPSNVPAQFATLDTAFAEKPLLTLLHIIPGLAFVILIPFQFSRSFRNRHLRLHRWMGRTIMVLGAMIGVSAFRLSLHPIGGALEASATLSFDAFFLFALTRAFLSIRAGNVRLHREWVIRAMSIALGVAATRPVMGIFFATSRLTGLTPEQFFGLAMWIGFTLTYVAGETWIRYTRFAPPYRALNESN
jgi:uncharacterized membrane protein